ncbi:MAG: hypothetical protein ACE5H5_02460, partial [Nitrospinota bacterium]
MLKSAMRIVGRPLIFVAVIGMLVVTVGAPMGTGTDRLALETINLPSGFSIAIYARRVPGARSMTLSPGGTLFVG